MRRRVVRRLCRAHGLVGRGHVRRLHDAYRRRDLARSDGPDPWFSTFSIIAFDPATNELGVGVQSRAFGAGAAVLLQYKGELHGIARKLGDEDLRAIMQFVLISLVILPVLPNQTYGP